MQHSWDLVLVSKNAGEAVALGPLVEALKARGATLDEAGHGTWKPAMGEVVVRPSLDAGKVLGLELQVPFRDTTDTLEVVVKALLEIADGAGVRVLDPQRSSNVTLESLSSLADEYLRAARYAGEYGGVSEALGLTSYSRPVDEDSSFKWLAAIVVFVIALYAAWKTVSAIRLARQHAEEDAKAQVAPAPAPEPKKQPLPPG